MQKGENIDQNHENYLARTPIFGGWLVMSTDDVRSEIYTGYSQPDHTTGYEWRTSITFVPDPNHEWDLSKDY